MDIIHLLPSIYMYLVCILFTTLASLKAKLKMFILANTYHTDTTKKLPHSVTAGPTISYSAL